jgi:hypothetical protein
MMYDHERSLVQRLADKPFALIGVNTDGNRESIKKIVKDKKLTWRSFWNGPGGTNGPITRQYGIQFFPTIYVLDHKGVIRYEGVQGKKMDEAVDTLLAELKGEGGGSEKKDSSE